MCGSGKEGTQIFVWVCSENSCEKQCRRSPGSRTLSLAVICYTRSLGWIREKRSHETISGLTEPAVGIRSLLNDSKGVEAFVVPRISAGPASCLALSRHRFETGQGAVYDRHHAF